MLPTLWISLKQTNWTSLKSENLSVKIPTLMSSSDLQAKLPGGKVFCRSCRIGMPSTEWEQHLSASHASELVDNRESHPVPSDNVAVNVRVNPTEGSNQSNPRGFGHEHHSTRMEDFLPNSFFDEPDESSNANEGDVRDAVQSDAVPNSDRRDDIEVSIRLAMSKRRHESDVSSDDDDSNWRRKKL